MAKISKKELNYLAELSRVNLGADEEEKILKDLGKVLNYFEELQELDTEKVEPMIGGTLLKNALREDVVGGTDDTGKGTEQFPDERGGYLKTPPVF